MPLINIQLKIKHIYLFLEYSFISNFKMGYLDDIRVNTCTDLYIEYTISTTYIYIYKYIYIYIGIYINILTL